MKPRTIVIISVVIIILICIGAYFFFINQSVNTPGSGTSSSEGNEVTLPAAQVLSGTPTGTSFTIGTPEGSVEVNNFYLTDPPVTDGGETVILASTTEYLVTYDTTDSNFWIGIDPSQFNAVRPTAEQALLSVLGVSSTVACKLDVSVGTFYSPTSTLNGQSFPLSFCENLNSGQ